MVLSCARTLVQLNGYAYHVGVAPLGRLEGTDHLGVCVCESAGDVDGEYLLMDD